MVKLSDVAVLIPYSYRGDQEHKNFEYVKKVWVRHFPDIDIYQGNGSVGENFNRAHARNDAAIQALAHEKFIFCDADTIYAYAEDIRQVLIREDESWFTCDNYHMLTKSCSYGVMSGDSSVAIEVEKSLSKPPGGILICSRDQFWGVGGFDEGFRGWGYEDTAFVKAMSALYGPPEQFGDVLHLWHEKNRSERQEQPLAAANRRRYGWYDAANSPDEMRRVLRRLKVLP